jgi:hypothetical protein
MLAELSVAAGRDSRRNGVHSSECSSSVSCLLSFMLLMWCAHHFGAKNGARARLESRRTPSLSLLLTPQPVAW